MVCALGPYSIRVDDLGNEGITGVAVLTMSHVSIHTWDKLPIPLFQFDLYSCNDFTVDDVIEFIDEFNFLELQYIKIDRNDIFNVLEQKIIKKS